MANILRKIALQITIPMLSLLIAANAYVFIKNLKRIGETTSNRVEATVMQADISNLLLDLDDMETGQRGYLLTGEPSYLQPYREAQARLDVHFSSLQSRLIPKASAQERSLEAQLEALAQSKITEMEETIRLRERGYRHRSFLLVNSNHGKELMDKARTTLNALSSAQASKVAGYDRELKDSMRRTYREAVLANCILLAVTVVTLLAFNTYSKRLELRCAQHSEQLRVTSTQLQRLTSAISDDLRALVAKTRSYAHALLELYGGFLPRQGQEQARQIEDGTGQMNRLLDDLFEDRPSGSSPNVVELRRARNLTA